MTSNTVGIVQGVSTNLAFALDPPWGAVASAGLTALFGGLFGGGSGPSEIQVIADMLNAAVNEIENFLSNLALAKASGDAHAFFDWVKTNIVTLPPGEWTEAMRDTVVAKYIPALESTDLFTEGSIFNNLEQLATEQYIKINTWVPRDSDTVFDVLLLTVTALIASAKLRIQLHVQCASISKPDSDGTCHNGEDQQFQDHSLAWQQVTAGLQNIVYGVNGYPDTFFPDVDQSNPLGISDNHQIEGEPYAGATPFDALADHFSNCPAPLIANLANVFNNLLYFNSAITEIKTFGGPDDCRAQYLAGEYGAAPQDFVGFAEQHGWAAALDRLLLHRWVQRLLAITNIVYIDDRDMSGGVHGESSTSGSKRFHFLDNVNGQDCAAVIDDGVATDEQAAATIIQTYRDTLTNALISLLPRGDDGVGKSTDLDATQGWRSALDQISTMLPPNGPATNGAVVADADWTANPPQQWKYAKSVCYAFSYTGANGPSLRGVWAADMDVNNRWKPKLRHLPADPNAILQLQVWRKFTLVGGQGQLIPDTPKIVATLDPGVDQYVDDDPGTLPGAKQ